MALLKPGNGQIFIPYNGPSMAIEMVQYLFLKQPSIALEMAECLKIIFNGTRIARSIIYANIPIVTHQ